MTLKGAFSENLVLKVLALFLAAALWFSLTLGQEEVARVTIPVELKNVPPLLAIAGVPPRFVECEISGPKIAMMSMRSEQLSVTLDLNAAREGSVSFTNLDRMVNLRRGLRVVRMQPASIELKLEKYERMQGAPSGP